jgi:hypothetical protein
MKSIWTSLEAIKEFIDENDTGNGSETGRVGELKWKNVRGSRVGNIENRRWEK